MKNCSRDEQVLIECYKFKALIRTDFRQIFEEERKN